MQRLPVFPQVQTNIVLTWHFALESTLPVPTLGCRQPFYPQVPNICSSGHIFALGSRMIISPRLHSRRWPIIRQLCIPQTPRRRWLPRRRQGQSCFQYPRSTPPPYRRHLTHNACSNASRQMRKGAAPWAASEYRPAAGTRSIIPSGRESARGQM